MEQSAELTPATSPQVTREVHPWVAEARQRIRFGIIGGPFADWAQQVDYVQMVEDLGFDCYWINDHPNRTLDPWTALAALAMVTKKIRLIPLVSCIYYHNPVLTARMAADVDRFSKGRVVLGIGIGDDVREFAQFAMRFPPVKERQQALAEAITIIRGLWSGQPFTFHGSCFQVEEARISPLPVQRPYIPILIAGGGEQVTLRQVAQYADMSNFGSHEWTGAVYTLADAHQKLAALRRHCQAVGRPYDAILRSHYCPVLVLADTPAAAQAKLAGTWQIPGETYRPFAGSPEEAIAHYQALADAGIPYFMACVRGNDLQTVRLLAERVLPALHPAV